MQRPACHRRVWYKNQSELRWLRDSAHTLWFRGNVLVYDIFDILLRFQDCFIHLNTLRKSDHANKARFFNLTVLQQLKIDRGSYLVLYQRLDIRFYRLFKRKLN